MRVLAIGVVLGLMLVRGARADEPLVELHVTQGADHRGHAALSLVVAPAPGLRLLADGPLTLDVAGETTRSLRQKDAVDPRAETPRFEVPLGKTETSLRAHLLAWVCRGQRCRPVELTQEIPVTR